MSQVHSPFLQFDFNRTSTTFEHPIEVITADRIDQVIPSLVKVQEAINQGYYAAGYLSYEASPAFEPSMKVHSNNRMPLVWFGIYKHAQNSTNHPIGSFHTSEWKPTTTIGEYNKAIQRIKDHIEKGETYQVNYTIRMLSEFQGDAYAYYKQLASSQSANYSAYLDIGDYKVLSASPELFFHLKEGKITTKPMKGTVGRGRTVDEDQENSKWLLHSEKNRAENVMIVDLLRNDLGRLAKPGTVKVPELFTIEKYPTVFQMTSTVTGEIDSDKSILDIFQALFPCGSITGAPKINTMNIIHELETSPREVYCGAIGFITPEQEAIFNVPIRTVILDKEEDATYGVGGGITWDSQEDEEYAEVLTKAKVLSKTKDTFQLIETIGLKNGEFLVLDNHLNRLENSASYFNFRFMRATLADQLKTLAKQYPLDNWKIRVLLSQDGGTTITILPEPPIDSDTQLVSLAKHPVSKNNIFLYHKTTNRTFYEKHFDDYPDVFDVLLWNENDEITEFTRGNVVVEIDGELYTPPVHCGLLAGTYREELLNEGKIVERVIYKKDIPIVNRIWFINSVKEWVLVHIR
ncbi:aminodeoxychorismate synthase component I [Ornithinibacillus californiensis]|uniref:aminodeoxychorismate synthase component I n=1 Tax=Ornithinibacillus californiensis TaxID=161536 RepID=UPI00064D9538|nr:aminodeoxychorismate synthase component I [Ornithinibacillus californiensis]